MKLKSMTTVSSGAGFADFCKGCVFECFGNWYRAPVYASGSVDFTDTGLGVEIEASKNCEKDISNAAYDEREELFKETFLGNVKIKPSRKNIETSAGRSITPSQDEIFDDRFVSPSVNQEILSTQINKVSGDKPWHLLKHNLGSNAQALQKESNSGEIYLVASDKFEKPKNRWSFLKENMHKIKSESVPHTESVLGSLTESNITDKPAVLELEKVYEKRQILKKETVGGASAVKFNTSSEASAVPSILSPAVRKGFLQTFIEKELVTTANGVSVSDGGVNVTANGVSDSGGDKRVADNEVINTSEGVSATDSIGKNIVDAVADSAFECMYPGTSVVPVHNLPMHHIHHIERMTEKFAKDEEGSKDKKVGEVEVLKAFSWGLKKKRGINTCHTVTVSSELELKPIPEYLNLPNDSLANCRGSRKEVSDTATGGSGDIGGIGSCNIDNAITPSECEDGYDSNVIGTSAGSVSKLNTSLNTDSLWAYPVSSEVVAEVPPLIVAPSMFKTRVNQRTVAVLPPLVSQLCTDTRSVESYTDPHSGRTVFEVNGKKVLLIGGKWWYENGVT